MLFTFGIAAVLRATGVYRMKLKRQAISLAAAAILCDVMVRSKMSSKIFYLLHNLSDPAAEATRIDILNQAVVLDGTINSATERP